MTNKAARLHANKKQTRAGAINRSCDLSVTQPLGEQTRAADPAIYNIHFKFGCRRSPFRI